MTTETTTTESTWTHLESLVVEWQAATADERRTLANKAAEARSKLKSLLVDAEARRDSTTALAKSVMSAVQELRRSLADSEEARAREAELERQLAERDKDIEKAKAERLKLEKALAERTDAAQAAQQKASELQLAVSRAQEGSLSTEARVAELIQALEESKASLGEMEARASALDKSVESGERALEEERRRSAKFEQTIAEGAEAEASAKQRIAELERNLFEETAQSRDLERRISELDAKLGSAAERIQSLRQDNQAAERASAELREKLSAAELAAKETLAARETLETELRDLRTEAERCRGERDEAREAVENVHEIRRQLEAEHERADLLSERLESEVARGTKSALAEQLARVVQENEDAHREMATLKMEMRRLKRNGAKGSAPKAQSQSTPSAAPVEETLQPAAVQPPPLPAETETAEKNVELPGPIEAAAAAEPSVNEDAPRWRLGERLVESGTITHDQLAIALEEQRHSPERRLETILVEQGLASEGAVAEALAGLSGVELVRLSGNGVQADAAKLITGRLASLHNCIPLRATSDTLTLAMANPLDLIAIEDVERASRRRVEAVAATTSDVKNAIQRIYGAA